MAYHILGNIYRYKLVAIVYRKRKIFYGVGKFADVAGFAKSATTAEIATNGYVLTPGRYVGAEAIEDDGEPFEKKMARLVAELNAQFAESAKLEKAITINMKELGHGG